MPNLSGYIANVLARHYRVLFFIDSNTAVPAVVKLMLENYRIWGGRFNPFIPVNQNKIDPAYEPLLPYFDPDIIYYSPSIDKDSIIAQCPFFNVKEYAELNMQTGNNLPGIFAGHLANEEFGNNLFLNRQKTFIHLSHSINQVTASFYQASFGLGYSYHGDSLVTAGFKSIEVGNEEFAKINEIIETEKPYFSAFLSEQRSCALTFRPNNDWEANNFEVIVYEGDTGISDAIYFWNRRLFQHRQSEIKQIMISIEQLELLKGDLYFEAMLLNLGNLQKLTVRSKSLPEERLNTLINELNQTFQRLRLEAGRDSGFPYPFLSERNSEYQQSHTTKYLLKSDLDYLLIPPAISNQYISNLRGEFMCDLELAEQDGHYSNYIRFPKYSDPRLLVSNQECRVNKAHNMSFFVDQRLKGLDIRVPSAFDLIRERLVCRKENGEIISLPIGNPVISPAGLKLKAFTDLFDAAWFTMDEFISDSFWLRLVMGNTLFKEKKTYTFKSTNADDLDKEYKELSGSNVATQRNFFSHKDLENELEHYYLANQERVTRKYTEEGIQLSASEVKKYVEDNIGHDFNYHIDPSLQYLVQQNALYIGMRVKCENCGTNAWYSLKELDNKMPCQGCQKIISPSVRSAIYYKFNRVVVNNFKSEETTNARTFDGNYVVLKALAELKTIRSHVRNSFHYSPCMQIEPEINGTKTSTDIDILAIVNGEFIIGEGKAKSSGFGKKEVDLMIWLGNHVRPDKIVLAYLEGQAPDDKIRLIVEGLTYKGCKVVAHRCFGNWHRFGKLFGLGAEEK